MYLKTPFRPRKSIYTHFFGAGEVLICTYLAPERPEKPENYLYTPILRPFEATDFYVTVRRPLMLSTEA